MKHSQGRKTLISLLNVVLNMTVHPSQTLRVSFTYHLGILQNDLESVGVESDAWDSRTGHVRYENKRKTMDEWMDPTIN